MKIPTEFSSCEEQELWALIEELGIQDTFGEDYVQEAPRSKSSQVGKRPKVGKLPKSVASRATSERKTRIAGRLSYRERHRRYRDAHPLDKK